MLVSVIVESVTHAICVLVRLFVTLFIHLEWMMMMTSYLLVLLGKSYIMERKIIVNISQLQSLCFHLWVSFLISNVTIPTNYQVSSRIKPCEIFHFNNAIKNMCCYKKQVNMNSVNLNQFYSLIILGNIFQ